jgi:hypothetical protein
MKLGSMIHPSKISKKISFSPVQLIIILIYLIVIAILIISLLGFPAILGGSSLSYVSLSFFLVLISLLSSFVIDRGQGNSLLGTSLLSIAILILGLIVWLNFSRLVLSI